MGKITSSPIGKKIINLCKIRYKNKLMAGLVNFDNFLLSIRITSRIEGQYVTFNFHLTKDNTLLRLKIRVSTFLKIFEKLQAVKDKADKDALK